MNVRVVYAPGYMCTTTQMSNPYDLTMTVEGDVDSVANWVDEHILAGNAAVAAGLNGKCQYEQGRLVPVIKEWLERGGIFDPPVSGYTGLLLCEHLLRPGGLAAPNYVS